MSTPAESASNLDPTSRTLSPWRITLVIVGIGLGGLLGMFVLLEQLSYSPLVETTIGSLFMLGLMTPAIYLILLRPMRRELRNQVETARILREIQAGLEDRVQCAISDHFVDRKRSGAGSGQGQVLQPIEFVGCGDDDAPSMRPRTFTNSAFVIELANSDEVGRTRGVRWSRRLNDVF